MQKELSIIIPAKNEQEALGTLLQRLINLYPEAEIIVVNDGSNDNTGDVASELKVTLISHPYSMGNGAAIKTGARAASGKNLVLMDGDGQHPADEISVLLDEKMKGYAMVIGERASSSHADHGRLLANIIFNKLASLITGHKITDLTSGFRIVDRIKFLQYLHLLPNGFSYPTTITMAFMRVGYPVSFKKVNIQQRKGNSHIKPIQDGVRFLLIIFRVASLYSPLKIFAPVSAGLFVTGISYYLYTYMTQARFTNMGILLLLTSIIVFLIGLLAEQITFLIYSNNRKD